MAFASAVEVLSREWNNELETEREEEELGERSAFPWRLESTGVAALELLELCTKLMNSRKHKRNGQDRLGQALRDGEKVPSI